NIRNKAVSDKTKELMYSVTKLDTKKQVLNVLEKIKESGEPEATAFTKMEIDIWNQTPNNTNINESSHANINQDGRSLTLLAAIYQSNDFDKRQWHSATTYEQYNIHESYRNKSELAHLTKNSKRSQKRKNKGKEPASRSTLRKKPKNQALNDEKSEDLFSISTSTPTTQEQDNYIEWENKKLELQRKNLEILREEIALREKLNSLKQLSSILVNNIRDNYMPSV
ncbi:17396_t:CDS:2, partial [Cetraspora pellucida]